MAKFPRRREFADHEHESRGPAQRDQDQVGGGVDFGIAGFHDIIIFKPGVRLIDLTDAGGGVFPSFLPCCRRTQRCHASRGRRQTA